MIAESPSLSLDLGSVLQAVTVALLLGGIAGFNKLKEQVTELTKDTKEWQARVTVALFGATGDNGLHGISKDHEARIRLLEQQSSEH